MASRKRRSSTSSSSSARTAASTTYSPLTCRRTGRPSQSSFRGHHRAGCQQECDSGTQLPEGAPAGGHGSRFDRSVPAEPAQAVFPEQPVAGPARRWAKGQLHLFRRGYFLHLPHASVRDEWREQTESGLPANYYPNLLSGGTGQTSKTPDQRISNVNAIPAGPFQLTNGQTFTYDSYAASPVHRFYQMWQQLNCSRATASSDNPSGCNGNLFAWVEVTVGAGTNGIDAAGELQHRILAERDDHGRRFNRVRLLQRAAGRRALLQEPRRQIRHERQLPPVRQRRHRRQPHHVRPRRRDLVQRWQRQRAARPPNRGVSALHGEANPMRARSTRSRIRIRRPGTNNWYTEDGYGESYKPAIRRPIRLRRSTAAAPTAIARIPPSPASQPILSYLRVAAEPDQSALRAGPLLSAEQLQPGLVRQRQERLHRPRIRPTRRSPFRRRRRRSIGDALNSKGISWKYYGDQWNNYVNDPYQLNYGTAGPTADEYCNICNPFQYDTSIMSNPDAGRSAHPGHGQPVCGHRQRHACRRSRSSSPAAWSTATRPPPSWICSKASSQKIVDQVRGLALRERHRDLHHLR